jgi:4-amino-4-deoxy-L-arabinose transferase-like glycosyltransferase
MDEALFGDVFFEPWGGSYSYHLGHIKLPFMMLPYLGTLKSWLFRPLFLAFGANVQSVRIPAVLAGAASIWLFYLLLRRLAGERAAHVGCGLLAADSMYLLSTCFDWGPVALQHLLLVGGMLCLVIFWQGTAGTSGGDSAGGPRFSPRVPELALACGFLCFGLAMWDKALAVWMLGGLGVAALVTVPRQIFGVVTIRRLALALAAFALGSLPLILYNIHTRGATLQGTAVFDASELYTKFWLVGDTFRGHALADWMVAQNASTINPHAPHSLLARASAAVDSVAGSPMRSLLLSTFYGALLLTPFARGRNLRTILFALAAMAVAWLQMALTAGAGGSVHHIILLWPLPQIIMGISLASASRRLGRAATPVLTAVLVVVISSALLVTNAYYVRMLRDGGAIAWSDAIFPLTDYLKRNPAGYIFCLDWGYLDTLRVLSNNRLPVRVGSDPISKAELTGDDRATLADLVGNPDHLFVAHTRAFEFFPGLSAKLVRFAQNAGYQAETLAVIPDSYGRPTFEVYRFLTTSAASVRR